MELSVGLSCGAFIQTQTPQEKSSGVPAMSFHRRRPMCTRDGSSLVHRSFLLCTRGAFSCVKPLCTRDNGSCVQEMRRKLLWYTGESFSGTQDNAPVHQSRALPPPAGGFSSGFEKPPANKIGRVLGTVKDSQLYVL